MTNPAPIRALGEIAIRCGDLGTMTAFYRDIVGLPLLEDFSESGIVFFKIAPGHGGHTTVLALFAHDAAQRDHFPRGEGVQAGARSSLHHLALTVDAADQPALVDWLEIQGLAPRIVDFDWIGWRGVFIEDPEGNVVEFVAGMHGSSLESVPKVSTP